MVSLLPVSVGKPKVNVAAQKPRMLKFSARPDQVQLEQQLVESALDDLKRFQPETPVEITRLTQDVPITKPSVMDTTELILVKPVGMYRRENIAYTEGSEWYGPLLSLPQSTGQKITLGLNSDESRSKALKALLSMAHQDLKNWGLTMPKAGLIFSNKIVEKLLDKLARQTGDVQKRIAFQIGETLPGVDIETSFPPGSLPFSEGSRLNVRVRDRLRSSSIEPMPRFFPVLELSRYTGNDRLSSGEVQIPMRVRDPKLAIQFAKAMQALREQLSNTR